ncbi:MAG: baseplate J/gp47 family protein [Chloroflexi bacterium]|nr:baseplate J/gp47 family protein [Chloroflexota bacterium]
MIDVQARRFAGPVRRQLVDGSRLNGIDYVEVDRDRADTLRVHFLKPVPSHAYGLREHPERITIQGGRRVTGLRAIHVTQARHGREQPEEAHLRVTLDRAGDASPYTLQIDVAELDPCLRRADFSFGGGPILADCRTLPVASPAPLEPVLDYEAKDYESFRGVLLDLVARLNPGWLERSPADLGIALVELLAYAGDRLSYLQDALMNEAYLDRVRLRISARRLARLLDYHMHDGRNAWTWAQFTVQAAGVVPLGTRLITRIQTPLANDPGAPNAPSVVIADPLGRRINVQTLQTDPALASAVVYETAHTQAVDPLNNEIRVHDWGIPGSQLQAGATAAFLYAIGPDYRAVRPYLSAGDWLLLEEALAPDGGPPDPGHRQVVQIQAEPVPLSDEVFSDLLVCGQLQLRTCPDARTSGALPLLLVNWRIEDAVRSPFLLSAPADAINGCPEPGASVYSPPVLARGNLVAADHGLSTTERLTNNSLRFGPITTQCPPIGQPRYRLATDGAGVLAEAERRDLTCDVRDAVPAVALRLGDDLWTPVPDLLESGTFDQVFVVEVDEAGTGHLRFGDGVEGREAPPLGPVALFATYRVGNGLAGQIGANALAHIVVAEPNPTEPWLQNLRITNPLAAIDGAEPETIDEVRVRGPQTASLQRRAVTEADYRAAALAVSGVAAAAASIRWSGSWSTVSVGIQGATDDLTQRLLPRVSVALERLRLVGQDIDVRSPRYVGLDLGLQVTIAPGYFRNEVLDDVTGVLTSMFVQPGAFTFGTAVYLSMIYAQVAAVSGVLSVLATRFHPVGQPGAGELEAGLISLGTFDIARLASDPDHPELGVLRLSAIGGKG